MSRCSYSFVPVDDCPQSPLVTSINHRMDLNFEHLIRLYSLVKNLSQHRVEPTLADVKNHVEPINQAFRSYESQTLILSCFPSPIVHRFAILCVLRVFPDSFGFALPFLLRGLITSIDQSGFNDTKLYWIAALVVFLTLQSLTFNYLQHQANLATMDLQAFLQSSVYHTAMVHRFSSTIAPAEVISVFSIDVDKVVQVGLTIFSIWTAPLNLIVCSTILYSILGPPSLFGILAMVLTVGLNVLIIPKYRECSRMLLAFNKKVLSSVTETLNGIKVIRLNAWEPAFIRRLQSIRRNQAHVLFQKAVNLAALTFFETSAPYFMTLATIWAVIASGNESLFTSETFLTTTLVFNMMYDPIMRFPIGVTRIFQTWDSVRKLQSFLNSEIAMENSGIAERNLIPGSFLLSSIVKQRRHVAIVGDLGCGKSSLLLRLVESQNASGPIGYVSQNVWLYAGSIKENILLGRPFNGLRYQHILKLTQLSYDFNGLPDGDMTYLETNGSNLSGGQRQRVALARALYCEAASCYALDDPFSSVDATVTAKILNGLFGPTGFLKFKPCVIVTSSAEVLKYFAEVYKLEKQEIRQIGACELPQIDFNNNFDATQDQPADFDVPGLKHVKSPSNHQQPTRECSIPKLQHRVPWRVYMTFAKYGNPLVLTAGVALLLSFQYSSVLADAFLAKWINNVASPQSFIRTYVSFGVIQGITLTLSSFLITYSLQKGTSAYFNAFTASILHAPFQHNTADRLGKLMNICSKDFMILDDELALNLKWWLQPGVKLTFVVFTLISIVPSLLVFVIPVAFGAKAIENTYAIAAKRCKILESEVRSKLLSSLQESTVGLHVVSAFQAQEAFKERFEKLIRDYRALSFALEVVSRWLAVTLELLSIIVITVTAVSCVVNRETLETAKASLVLNYAVQITFLLRTTIKWGCEFEGNMTSVERIHQHIQPDQEFDVQEEEPQHSGWSPEGKLTFSDYEGRYYGSLKSAIKVKSLEIIPNEKVCIVGRTGAGKSSLGLALFQLLETVHGQIEIDGKNISTMGRGILRRIICTVPQEPVLFSGSIRFNLDPPGVHSDVQLWRVLDHVNLRENIWKLPNKLEESVEPHTSRFSAGTKQLMCLARALLRDQAKIMVLDEALSHVDNDTEQVVMKRLLNGELRNKTVMVISHKPEAIKRYSRVIHVEEGEILQ